MLFSAENYKGKSKRHNLRANHLEDLATIINELAAPVKTFRIFAIEKAIKSGTSANLLQELENRRRQEDDSECRMLLDHAIETVKERLSKTAQPKSPAQNKVTPADFARMNSAEQLQTIRKTSASAFKAEGGAAVIKVLWNKASQPIVKAEIVKKCCQFWPAELADLLESSLTADSSVLQVASLEAIINSFPDRLQKNFDKLVMSRDPIIRATAIRGLARKRPQSAAVFLAESLRKGDYYTRLAALRAISVMPFNLNRSSLIELLVHEQDEQLLKIIAAIILANPDREIPFRICDIIEKAPLAKHAFLLELQKNCCAMIRMAELCPDIKPYLATLKKYPNRVKSRLFVQNCINIYESADGPTREELVSLLREKRNVPEVAEAITAAQAQPNCSELLIKIMQAPLSEKAAISQDTSADTPENWLKSLIRLRTSGGKDAKSIISKAFSSSKPLPALISAALRAATSCNDGQWVEKAKQCLRNENEDLVAAALEYLATFDNESFLLQIRRFINSSSMVIRTALLRSLCQQNPENARELLASMLGDKDNKVRDKAIGSLIQFEFAGIRDLLSAYLEKEKNGELISACLSLYLANPLLESTYDLFRLGKLRPDMQSLFEATSAKLTDSLSELNLADHAEIANYLDKRQEKESAEHLSDEENKENTRLAGLARKINWNSLAGSMEELSQYYPLLKKVFLAVIMLLAIFLLLTGSEDDNAPQAIEGYTPVASQVQEFSLLVQKLDAEDGSLIGTTADRQKVMALPRPGKIFVTRPGDSLTIRAMPFRKLPDGTLVVKTIEVKKVR